MTSRPCSKTWRRQNSTQTDTTYDLGNGHLKSTYDQAANLTTNYFDSATGLILKRERYQGTTKSSTTAVGNHFYYYADGRRIGDVSDDPSDNARISYAEALARKAQTQSDPKTLYKTFKPVSSADFDQNFEPINDTYPAQAASSYTVNGSGEDLQSIALALWGDRSMWYLLAEANGLSTADGLKPGQVLVIPNKVTNVHNNAGTFRPYNAGEAIGRIDPTLPAPPPPPVQDDGGCGVVGQIVLIAVAVAVTVYTAGAASGLAGSTWQAGLSVLGGSSALTTGAAVGAAAVGGAAGSIASQGVGMATGLQDGFSWRQVALSALGSAATAGVATAANQFGALSFLKDAANPWVQAGRAGLSNAAVQVLQGSWNWQGVLASSLGAGVGSAASSQLAGTAFGQAADGIGAKLVGGFAGSVAAQLAGPGGRANYLSSFTATLGAVIGNSLGDSIDARPPTPVGSGLRVKAATASSWGPQYSFDGLRESQQDYSLASGAAVQLGTGSADAQPIASGDSEFRQEQLARIMRLASAPEALGSAGASYRVEIAGTRANLTNADFEFSNRIRVDIARQNGEDLAPTIAHAARLRLEAVNGGLSGTELAQRFGHGLVGGVKAVTVEPVLQVRDMAMALASVTYNELLRSDGDAQWLPEMKSGIAEAYANGASQTRLLLQSNPLTGIGVLSYDLPTASMNGDWGSFAEMGGGLVGGFALGKATSAYGTVRWTPGDIGTMPRQSQRGATTLFNFGSATTETGGKVPVQLYDVMTYGESKLGAVVGDGLSGDHIPSYAAIRRNVETTLGRELTADEATALRNNTNTVIVGQDLHAAGRTYFGANAPGQVAVDSFDLLGAARSDQAVHLGNASSLGYSSVKLGASFERLNQMNQRLFNQLSTEQSITGFFTKLGVY